jgi:hypothetical protein
MFSESVFVPDEIIQIGCGGVGSRIVDEMRYFIRGNFDVLRRTQYTLVDHDILSESNLNRQLFFPHEAGDLSKGQILVNRYRDLIKIRQIPEAINDTTISAIFNQERLRKKLLVIVSADNHLVVKQVMLHLLANAQEDYLWIFTGANLVPREIAGKTIEAGVGQAYAYGQVRGTPLFPIPPNETLLDIMSASGFGPGVGGAGCGVTDSSGAQTPLMNQTCVNYVFTIINMFFTHGIFIPCIYFTDGDSVTIGDRIPVDALFSTSVPQNLGVDTTPPSLIESGQAPGETPAPEPSVPEVETSTAYDNATFTVAIEENDSSEEPF